MIRNSKYVYGTKDSKLPISLNFGDFIIERLLQYKNRVAFVNATTHESKTYREVVQEAVNLAVSLKRLGVKKGETVAICSENRQEFFPTAIGVVCTGAILTPLNVIYSRDEMKHVLNISKPKYIIVSPAAFKSHKNAFKSLEFIKKIIVFGKEKQSSEILYNDLVASNVTCEDFEPVGVQGQTDTMVILYSSGTTGLPKGVMLTHLNVLAGCNQVPVGEHLPDLTALFLTPFYHTMGLMVTFVSLSNGRKVVYLPKFDERNYLQTIQNYKAELLVLVPPVIIILTKSKILDEFDVSSVRLMYSGAAPLEMETIEEVKTRFPNLLGIMQGYGMTEVSLPLCELLVSDLAIPGHPRLASSGFPTPGAVIKVLDIDSGKPLGVGQRGEICMRGQNLMKGYVGRDRAMDFDDEGFFKTGDIGYYDEEGYFYIVDRLKELIKYKGHQVPPAELEGILLQHPGVRDAAVIGLPDRVAGELPLAFVVKQPGAEVSAKEIADFVAAKVSHPKRLRGGVRFINEIPKNPTGKIIRRKLKDMVKSAKSKL